MAQLGSLIVNGAARVLGKIYGNLKGNVTVPYLTCSTAADTAAKTVDCSGFELEAGAKITVKFTNANSANSPTMNVNGTGAKNIYQNGMQITTGANRYLLSGTVEFIYDGTNWVIIGGSNNSVLLVTFNYSSGRYTADKTYSEIENALLAGKCVIGKRSDNLYYVTDWSVNSSITFRLTYYNGSSIYSYYYYVTPSSVGYNWNSYYPPQIDTHSYVFEIVYEQSQDKYVISDISGSGSMYGINVEDILEWTGHNYALYARLMSGYINNNTGDAEIRGDNGYHYEDSELFHLDKIDYDPNFYYDYYGSDEYGGVVLYFNNNNNSKTITIKIGRYDSWCQLNPQVTITNNSGGGGDVMFVNVTYANNFYSANKTYSEIASAISNNKNVICVYGTRNYYLNSIYPEYVYFQTLADPQTYGVYSYTISISNNNIVSREQRNFAYDNRNFTTIIDVYYDNDNNKYSIYDLYGDDIYLDDMLYNTYGCFPVVKLLQSNNMDDCQYLYCTNIQYDSNYQYSFYGDTEDIQTGGFIFTFKNSDRTKTATIKMGYGYYILNLSLSEFAEITVTNSGGIPAAPSTNGTYILKCVVSSGTPTYSWEEAQQGSGVQF